MTRQIGVRRRPHRIALQNPGPNIPTTDGGYTNSWTDLDPPAVFAEVKPADAESLERIAAGTVISTATHIITFPYHAEVTTQTRVIHDGRTFAAVSVVNPDEANVETVLVCVEVVR